MNELGRAVFIFGLIIAAIGFFLWKLAGKTPLGRLPGDISIQRPSFSFYFPLTTCILVSIILPLSRPVLATVAIFAFVGNWNNLLGALIYLRSTDKFTLPLGLNLFNGQYVTAYNQLMAVSILTILPIVVTFFVAQKYFVQGVALGQGEK